MLTWDALEATANSAISIAYFCIAALIIIPLARLRQLRANKLGTATAAIFLSCAVGHGMHAVHTTAPHIGQMPTGQHLGNMATWWTASWHVTTAVVAVYYLTLRRFYGRLLSPAPMYDDLAERQRVTELEAFTAEAAARVDAEGERGFYVALMRSISRYSHSMIFVKNLEGRYLMVNEAFERFFRVSEPEIIGETGKSIDQSMVDLWNANNLEARDGVYRLEETVDRPDGRHYFDSTGFPVYDKHSSLLGTCGVALDVTALRRVNAELQAAQQAAAEVNTALTHARDAAIAATAAKSTFLATMSHEIRTPMNAVIGMTDLLMDTALDEQQQEFVHTVRSSGDALLAVINDVLDFSKIEAGEMNLVAIPFNLGDEVERCLDIAAVAAAAKDLDLVCYLDDTCPSWVVGDADRMRQIVINLVSNAVKFTDSGSVLVNVVAAPVERGKLQLTIDVIDTGIGITPAGLSGLFKSFSQVDGSATRTHGGTGLGLTISQRLAQAMGGDVSVTSTPGEGSTFTATIIVDHSEPPAPVIPAEPSTTKLHGLSVLIVDDNLTNLHMLDLQLSQLGLQCTTAATPADALAQVLEGLTYDVAVVDMRMPEMDGLQLAAALRQVPGQADRPVILLTSVGTRPLEVGGDIAATLAKPVKRAALREVLSTAVSQQKRKQPSRPSPMTLSSPPLRVLLAEDNRVNQRVAQLMLDKLGHTVETVADGRAAVDTTIAAPYDVVLMDVQMPEMDGLEATRTIRSRLPAEQQPYLVAMTANATAEDRDACAAAGMEDFLTKPVRVEALRDILDRVSATIRPEAAPAGGNHR